MTTTAKTPLHRGALRKFRKQTGLSLAELARLASLSESMLCQFELGNRGLSNEALTRVQQALEEVKRKQKSRKLRRLRAGLTETQLARATKIPRKKIIQWEARQIELTYEEQDRLMGVIYDAIAKREQPPVDSPVYQKALAEYTAAFNAQLPDPVSLYQLLQLAGNAQPSDFIEQRKEFVTRLENLKGIDDPVIAEIVESFRREIAALEKQLAEAKAVTARSEQDAD
jgi:transcriptional regulator with XRE-family HTH domain